MSLAPKDGCNPIQGRMNSRTANGSFGSDSDIGWECLPRPELGVKRTYFAKKRTSKLECPLLGEERT